MANYTDETIPVECWECSEPQLYEGIRELEQHLSSVHNFPLDLAVKVARNWADDIYERDELWERGQCERYRSEKRHGR